MRDQREGKKAPSSSSMSMKEPTMPLQRFPPQKTDRKSRKFETGSPQWPSPPPPPSFPRTKPAPAELIDRYVTQGMEREAASEKVIEDLQAALQRSLYPMQRLAMLEKTFRTSADQFESASQCLTRIESKLDSKPNIAQVFSAGVAAGVFLQTAIKATPPVLAAINDVLGSIKRTFQR